MSQTAAASVRLARPSLHAEVADVIRERITDGTLAPGGLIPEVALSEEFGISRTPIREALKVLASEGLVDIHPNRGSVVATLSTQEAQDAVELVAELEGIAAGFAAKRASDATLAAIADRNETMIAARRRDDLKSYARENLTFHAAIVTAGGNAALVAVHGSTSARLRRLRFLNNIAEMDWDKSIREHAAIVAALQARNGRLAQRLLRSHVGAIIDVVGGLLAHEPTPPAEIRRPHTRSRPSSHRRHPPTP